MSNNRRFRKYNGKDKYHFRFYKKFNHPFIVVYDDEVNKILSGYVLTTSPTFRKGYYQLSKNPNPNNPKRTYVTTYRVSDKYSCFSKPYNNWHLSDKDVSLIDYFEQRRKK